jgi:hypothetical protein
MRKLLGKHEKIVNNFARGPLESFPSDCQKRDSRVPVLSAGGLSCGPEKMSISWNLFLS